MAKLLDFLVAPHPIDEDVLSDDKVYLYRCAGFFFFQ